MGRYVSVAVALLATATLADQPATVQTDSLVEVMHFLGEDGNPSRPYPAPFLTGTVGPGVKRVHVFFLNAPADSTAVRSLLASQAPSQWFAAKKPDEQHSSSLFRFDSYKGCDVVDGRYIVLADSLHYGAKSYVEVVDDQGRVLVSQRLPWGK